MLAARWISSALFILAVPVFLLLSNVRIAAMEPRVAEWGIAHYHAEQTTGIDRAQLDRAAREIAVYFRNDQPLLGTRVVIDGVEQPLFSPRESTHMRDVKDLFQKVFTLQEIAFVYVVAYVACVFLWARERPLYRLARLCIVSGILTSVLLALGAIAVVLGFDQLFEEFHVLSFANDFWQLDPTRDHLIQMFPRDFWFAVSLAIGAATVFEGTALALAGIALRHQTALSHRGRVMPQRPAPSPAPNS